MSVTEFRVVDSNALSLEDIRENTSDDESKSDMYCNEIIKLGESLFDVQRTCLIPVRVRRVDVLRGADIDFQRVN